MAFLWMRCRSVLLAVGIACACLLALGPCLRCGFTTYDDADYVTANRHVQAGLTPASVVWAFTSFEHANWHPLTWLSLQLDAQLHGLDPFGFHLTNLLLHIVAALLLFRALQSMTGHPVTSATVAVLFGVHPLHVESVAWIAERKDVLCAVFFMAAIAVYGRAAAEGRRWPRLTVLLLTALALLAKPMAVTLPCVLLLLDFWPLSRLSPGAISSMARLAREKWALFLLSMGSCVLTFIAQHQGEAVRSFQDSPLTERLANMVHSYATYLWQMVWPKNLVVLYPYVRRTFADPEVLAALSVLAIISGLAFAVRRTRPHLLTGWLWYLGTLIPVIGVVSVGEQDHADRYTYIPLVGIFLAVVWEARALAQRGWGSRLLVGLVGVTTLVLCVSLSRKQCQVWTNGETLWLNSLTHTRPTVSAVFGLASFYRNEGRAEEAAHCFGKVLVLDPTHRQARANLAWSLVILGEHAEADRQFLQVLPNPPRSVEDASRLGQDAIASNQPGLAAAYFNHVIVNRPGDANAHLDLAVELVRFDQPRAGLRHLTEAERLNGSMASQERFQAAMAKARQAIDKGRSPLPSSSDP